MNIRSFRSFVKYVMLTLVFGVLLFQFYVFLSVSRDKRMGGEKKTVADFEKALCRFSDPKGPHKRSEVPCPEAIVTSFKSGNLATQMWLYTNVLATAINVGLEPYIPYCLQVSLSKVFDGIIIPVMGNIGHCFLPLPESASSLEDWSGKDQSIVVRATELCNDLSVKVLDLVRGHFAFTPELRQIAAAYLHRAKRNRANATYVGVYIRQTDIILNQEYDDLYPSVQFFLDAMNYFRKKYPNAVFVVVVDQKSFWASTFRQNDVHIFLESNFGLSEAALSVLAHCNHTILASEDYAVWGAILSGGETIVSLCLSESYNNLIQSKKNWNYLLNNTHSVNRFLERLS